MNQNQNSNLLFGKPNEKTLKTLYHLWVESVNVIRRKWNEDFLTIGAVIDRSDSSSFSFHFRQRKLWNQGRQAAAGLGPEHSSVEDPNGCIGWPDSEVERQQRIQRHGGDCIAERNQDVLKLWNSLYLSNLLLGFLGNSKNKMTVWDIIVMWSIS